ncbi:hypothetical protein ANT2_3110 [plant metagenome]|uniref:Uncharacterized protein n=1 Tax=plant metagenome TaxID=1297885 RepID=A0A484RMM8_9ZZZZ
MGAFFAAGPSQGKKRPPPPGGSKPKAQRGGNSYQPDTQSEREWITISTFQAMVATRACRHV